MICENVDESDVFLHLVRSDDGRPLVATRRENFEAHHVVDDAPSPLAERWLRDRLDPPLMPKYWLPGTYRWWLSWSQQEDFFWRPAWPPEKGLVCFWRRVAGRVNLIHALVDVVQPEDGAVDLLRSVWDVVLAHWPSAASGDWKTVEDHPRGWLPGAEFPLRAWHGNICRIEGRLTCR